MKREAVSEWIGAGIRAVLLVAVVTAINPHIDSFHLFIAVVALSMVVRMLASDECGS